MRYNELRVWQDAMALTKSVYAFTAKLPSSERFGLASQMQRAAVSIPSNIAEGNSLSTKSYLRHLAIARGSLAELQTQLLICNEVFELDSSSTFEMSETVSRQLHGLMKSLKSSLSSPPLSSSPRP